jgi:hypothetical protein
MAKLGLQIVAGLAIATIAFACASDPPEDFVPPEGAPDRTGSTVPGGDGGGGSSTSSGGSSSGTTGTGDAAKESGPSADCSQHAKVSDKPACDTCTKSKCCSEIQACDASPSCKQMEQCIAACGSDDFSCVLTCASASQTGFETFNAVGTCASQKCPSECPSDFDFDGGFGL